MNSDLVDISDIIFKISRALILTKKPQCLSLDEARCACSNILPTLFHKINKLNISLSC